MLILTRKKNEAIMIGENVEIKVLEVKDGQVRVGIDAPREISIFRKEVYDAIQEENRRAATAGPLDMLDDVLDQNEPT